MCKQYGSLNGRILQLYCKYWLRPQSGASAHRHPKLQQQRDMPRKEAKGADAEARLAALETKCGDLTQQLERQQRAQQQVEHRVEQQAAQAAARGVEAYGRKPELLPELLRRDVLGPRVLMRRHLAGSSSGRSALGRRAAGRAPSQFSPHHTSFLTSGWHAGCSSSRWSKVCWSAQSVSGAHEPNRGHF